MIVSVPPRLSSSLRLVQLVLTCSVAMPRISGDEVTRRLVCVRAIDYATTAEQLHAFFTTVQHAPVKKVTLNPVRAEQSLIRGPAVSSGQGVVEFEDAGTAQRLITAGEVDAPGIAYNNKRGEGPMLRCALAVALTIVNMV
jgi:hypothetical protein